MNGKILTALVRYLAKQGIDDATKVNAVIHDLATFNAAMSGRPEVLRGFAPRAVAWDTEEGMAEGLQEWKEGES